MPALAALRRTALTPFRTLPAVRGHLPLVVALAVDAVGSGCALPLLLLFLVRVADLPVTTAGLLLSGSSLVSLAVPALVAAVVGRIGARTTVVIAQVVQAAGVAGFLVARSVPLLAVAALLAAVGMRAFWSAVFAVVADAAAGGAAGRSEDTERERWFALSGMLQGGGFAAGALVAGVLISLPGAAPYLVALGLNAVSYGVSALLLLGRRGARPAAAAAREPVRMLADRPYLLLIAVNTLFAFCSVVLGTGLPLYAVDALGAPGWVVGPLLALSTLLGATCQGVAVSLAGRRRRTRVLAFAGLVWTAFGLVTAALRVAPAWVLLPGLLLCVLAYAVAELVHAPISMGVASAAAPAASRAGYLSWFQYSFALAVVAGPAVFTSLYAVEPALPWLFTALVALVAAGGMLAVERLLGSRLG